MSSGGKSAGGKASSGKTSQRFVPGSLVSASPFLLVPFFLLTNLQLVEFGLESLEIRWKTGGWEYIIENLADSSRFCSAALLKLVLLFPSVVFIVS